MLSMFPLWVFFGTIACLLWRDIYLDLPTNFLLFFLLILNRMTYLYILESNPLSVALFTNIFLILWLVFFILFKAFFCCAETLSLIKYHLLIFVFNFLTLSSGFKKWSCYYLYQRMFCLCFPLRVLKYWPYICVFNPFLCICVWCYWVF